MPDFTKEQDSAVEWRRQDACVVAGPGSGKTTVLVERYRSLVEDHGFDINAILAITFTEKAAANMKAKLAEKFSHNAIRLREFDSSWVSTIHGFCARLLRENAIAAGIDPGFRVLDARESDELQFECLNAALDELVELRREEALELIAALQNPRVTGDLKSAYDAIRSAGMSIEEVRALPAPPSASSRELAARLADNVRAWPFKLTDTQKKSKPELEAWAPVLAAADELPFPQLRQLLYKPPLNLNQIPTDFRPEVRDLREKQIPLLLASALDRETAPFRALIFEVLLRFHALYNERKTALAALDFNDLERRAIAVLEQNEDVRARVRTKFRQIMLDEFQDVNQQQNQLIDLIRAENVFFAVGDSNQSIYGFRHARPEIFREYRRRIEDAGKHTAGLLHNFRSRPEILRSVEALLNSAEGIDARELIAGKAFAPKATPSIEILRVMANAEEEEGGADEEEDGESSREARWIAHRVLELRRETGFDFRDFAVLCRGGDSMKPILFEFDSRRIPYVCGRRQSFLVSREGRNIAALLATLANPLDTVSLTTVLRSDLIGLSDEALLRIRLLAKNVAAGLNMLAFDDGHYHGFSAEDAARLRRFNAALKRWRADLLTVPLDVLISRMLSDCAYVWTPASPAGDNVEAFLHLARTRGANRPLLEFLRDLEGIEKGLSTESDLSDEDQGNCVQVMTAHAAKGLEFKVTIIAAMQQGTRKGSAAISLTPEHGLGIKWKDSLNERDGLKDSWARANSDTLKTREEHESNRLLYVAMTRAEEHLILSYSRGKKSAQNWAKLVENWLELGGQRAAHVFSPDYDPPAEDLAARQIMAPPVIEVPRPSASDQFDTAVNVTSLTLFGKCPRRYYLDRYLGWQGGRRVRFDPEALDETDLDDGDLSASELGSQVHELLAGKPGEYSSEAERLAGVFQTSHLGRRAAASPKSAREWDFIANLEGTLVRGSIDLWFEEGGNWFEEGGNLHIVDYKTDTKIDAENYAPQLALYALALEKALGRMPTAASLHFLRADVIKQIPLDEPALEQARTLIARLREAQDTLTFPLKPADHCRSCPFYRTLCPAETAA